MALVTEALPLVNEALVIAGERPLVSLTDPTTAEMLRAVEAVYEPTYRSVFSRLRLPQHVIHAAFTTAVTLPRTPGTAPTDPDDLADYNILNTDSGHPDYPYRFTLTAAPGVTLPDALLSLEFYDAVTGEPITDFRHGYDVLHLTAANASGAKALVLVRPPEGKLSTQGPAREVFCTELAHRLSVRLGVKNDIQEGLRQKAREAWRQARAIHGPRDGERGDFIGTNPFDQTDNGGKESWLTARY